MDFTIPEALDSARQLAQQILNDFTAPEQLQAVEQSGAHFDHALWQALAEAGLLGLDIPEAHGGIGLGFYALGLLCEEVGRTAAPLPIVPVLASAASTLQRFADEALHEAWLPGITRGEVLVSAALEEYLNPDPAAPSTRASADGDGYRLSGSKICVPLAGEAQRILLSARAEHGLVVALLDPGSAGVQLYPQRVTSGETRHELVLEEVAIDAADIVASGDQALAAMQWAREATRAALCASVVGLCDRMMRMTGSYTSERQQFGRAVATFQAVSHQVANCYIDTECLRLVTQQALSLLDAGQPAGEAVTIAKIWCGDASHRVSQSAQHCHGGTGVDRDYPLYRFCLQARQLELSLGSSAQLTGELGRAIAAGYAA